MLLPGRDDGAFDGEAVLRLWQQRRDGGLAGFREVPDYVRNFLLGQEAHQIDAVAGHTARRGERDDRNVLGGGDRLDGLHFGAEQRPQDDLGAFRNAPPARPPWLPPRFPLVSLVSSDMPDWPPASTSAISAACFIARATSACSPAADSGSSSATLALPCSGGNGLVGVAEPGIGEKCR